MLGLSNMHSNGLETERLLAFACHCLLMAVD